MKDIVKVSDHLALLAWERDQEQQRKEILAGISDKELPIVEGFFSALCRERGKIVKGSHREGKNIWTLTGREYLAQVMSYASYGTSEHGSGSPNPNIPLRDDRIRYIGFGTGTQPEVSSVSALFTPIAFDIGSDFLAQLAIPSFPLSPAKTTVRYSRVFAETELSVAGSVILQEAGLFTDGGSPTFAPGTRNISFGGGATAAQQAPAAYKTFEPLKKTQNFLLEVFWEVRF